MRSVIRHPGLVALRLAWFLALNARGWLEHRRELGRAGQGSDPASVRGLVAQVWGAQSGGDRISVRAHRQGPDPRHGGLQSSQLPRHSAARGSRPHGFRLESRSGELADDGGIGALRGNPLPRRNSGPTWPKWRTPSGPSSNPGTVVTIFPEGTSSAGDDVLPFRPSLLEPAAANGWPVTPGRLTYEIDASEGTRADDVAYWRDMTFAPHFLNLLAKKTIRCGCSSANR